MIIRITILLILLSAITVKVWSQKDSDQLNIITVLSFNILHGATTNGDFDLDVIAQVINESNSDVVALQEVDFKTNRAKQMDLTTELGWRTGMASLFGKAMKFDGGEYGEGILSKYTFIKTRTVPLPHSPGNEPRAALEVLTVLPSGDTIAIVGTHLDHLKNSTDRIAQVEKLNEVFSRNIYPTLLLGDLNATPGSEPIQILEKIWTPTYDHSPEIQHTYPSDGPTKKIDYVLYFPKHRWKVLATKNLCDTIASDHCGYLATLQLLDE